MIAVADPTVLVTLIGAPAAIITAIGTVLVVVRRGGPQQSVTNDNIQPVQPKDPNLNGYRYVTQKELGEVVKDMKTEIRESERRTSTQLQLIVELLKKNGG